VRDGRPALACSRENNRNGGIGDSVSWHLLKDEKGTGNKRMAKIGGNVALREIRVLFGVGSTAGMTDGELLERFSLDRDEAGELAFEALVNRHGAMVMRTCRGILHDSNDADDAFQATFLVLARKADSLWVAGTIAPWLHGVAFRIATRALSDRARRQRHEQRVALLAPSTTTQQETDDLGPVLHAEIERLPERFRSPIVLCYLEGLTHDQAARQLDWPVGTVRSRLSRGRERLRAALHRRGISLTGAMPIVGLSAPSAMVVRPALVESAVRAATWIALGNAAAGVGPAVAGLTRGVLMTMALNKLSKMAAGILLTALVASGAAAYGSRDSEPASRPAATDRKIRAIPPARPRVPPRSEAEIIAERVLNHGATLFNAKDSAALAASYTADGTIRMMAKEDGQQREELKRGRAEVEQFYRDYFRDAASTRSENIVEFARLVTPDLLIIHGRFRPDRGAREVPFVQMRSKQEDKWLTNTLWLFLQPDGH
jgi:RNA polymerase sigma factor (sigma-70 family)